MPFVPYHTHTFDIPTATPAQVADKTPGFVVTADVMPSNLDGYGVDLGAEPFTPTGSPGTTVQVAIDTLYLRTRHRRFDVSAFGADPDASSAVNTIAIQSAINAAFAEGGGEVFVPFKSTGIYRTIASSETDMVVGIGAGPVLVSTAVSSMFSLLLRSNVDLVMDDGVVIECTDTSRSIMGLKDMQGGGIRNGWMRGVWNPAAPVGAAHGILTVVSVDPNDSPNMNMVFEKLRVSNVASYGMGMGIGFMRNNKYRDLWIHDVGADTLDHKARPTRDGQIPVGNYVNNLLSERYGRRVIASTGLDIRGPVVAEKITCRDFAIEGMQNVGIRLDPGLWSSNSVDIRQSSENCIVSDIQIDSGDPTVTDTFGVHFSESGGLVHDGYIRNCNIGVTFRDSTSGWGSNDCAGARNLMVEGSRNIGIEIGSVRTSTAGCSVKGQTETFESTKGNLAAAQTSFVSPRPFEAAAVQVYKNDVLLTVSTDYSVTGTTTITLVTPAISTDRLEIVSPTSVGYSISGKNTLLFGNRTQYVTTPRSVLTTPALQTLIEDSNIYEGQTSLASYFAGTSAILEVRGDAADLEAEVRGKGTAGVTLRTDGRRAFRASAPASAVNYPDVIGSIASSPVALRAQGSDANIDILLAPKGTSGRVRLGTFVTGSDSVTNGYIEVKDAAGNLRKIPTIP
jgi:hypothetical protein